MLTIRNKPIAYKSNPWGYQTSNGYDQVCIHNTANSASAENEWAYMNSRATTGQGYPTVHYFVDELEAIKCMPHNVDAWAVSDGSGKGGNTTDIHIEICRSTASDGVYKKAYANAILLIAKIFEDEGWEPEARRISFHHSYGTKYCPHKSLNDFGGDGHIGSTASNKAESRLRDAIIKDLEGDYPMKKLPDTYNRAEIWQDENVQHGGKFKVKMKVDTVIRRYYPETGKMKDTGRYVRKGHYETTDFFKKEKGSDGYTRNYHALVNNSRTNTQIDLIQVDSYK